MAAARPKQKAPTKTKPKNYCGAAGRPRLAHPKFIAAIDASLFTRQQLAVFLDVKLPQLSDYLNHLIPNKSHATERIARLAAFVGYRGPVFEGGPQ